MPAKSVRTTQEQLQDGLFGAINTKNYYLVEKVIEEGALLNGTGKQFEFHTPLSQAVENMDKKMVELLLKKGANPNLKSYQPFILTLALYSGEKKPKQKEEILKVLLNYGATVDKHPSGIFSEQDTPLIAAFERGTKQDVQLILDHNVNLVQSIIFALFDKYNYGPSDLNTLNSHNPNKEFEKMIIDKIFETNHQVQNTHYLHQFFPHTLMLYTQSSKELYQYFIQKIPAEQKHDFFENLLKYNRNILAAGEDNGEDEGILDVKVGHPFNYIIGSDTLKPFNKAIAKKILDPAISNTFKKKKLAQPKKKKNIL